MTKNSAKAPISPLPLAYWRALLTGKSAVVTGGAKGIGAGIAYRLAEAGAAVLVADLDGDGAGKTAAAMAAKGGGPRRPPWTYRARRRWQA